jgi:hypothetical protein
MHTYIVTNGKETAHVRDMAAVMATAETLAEGGTVAIWERFADGGTRSMVNPAGHALPATLPELKGDVTAPPSAPEPVKVAPPSAPEPVKAPPAAPPSAPAVTVQRSDVDASAKARIDHQQNVLRAAGVTGVGYKGDGHDGGQFFTNGTRTDVAKMAREARQHAALMPFSHAAEELRARVQSEGRRDVEVTARDFARSIKSNGKVTAGGLKVTEQAIRGVIARIESPAIGHLLGLRDRIAAAVECERAKPEGERDFSKPHADRAELARILAYECERAGDVRLQLRTREALGDIFAIVSPGYVPADAPAVIPEILKANLPRDAKGSWSYDPVSTRWELTASIWTPTPAAEMAVGEAFKGYVTLGSKDNGGGRFKGGGGITLIRCVNASTYNATTADVARRHVGRIMSDVDRMVAGGLKAIDALCVAWGRNRADEILLPVIAEKRVTIEDAIPGFWRWLLRDQSSELQGVLPGRSEAHVTELTRAFAAERRDPSRLVRSDLAQGFTRYIQGQPVDVRRDAESAIGSWLVNGKPVGFRA